MTKHPFHRATAIEVECTHYHGAEWNSLYINVRDSLNEKIIVICKDELRQGWEWWCASHQPCLMAVATVEPCTARKAAIIKLTIGKKAVDKIASCVLIDFVN